MLLKIHPEHPEGRKIKQAVETLEKGGVIIYPTDTVYGLGCDIYNHKAVDRICKLRGLDPVKARLSFICKDISQVAEFSKQIDNTTFRLMKKHLPGPFTFVLNSNNSVPKLFKNRKRTIGVRVPDNNICHALVEGLDRPILTASLRTTMRFWSTSPIRRTFTRISKSWSTSLSMGALAATTPPP